MLCCMKQVCVVLLLLLLFVACDEVVKEEVSVVVDGLDNPWAISFVSDELLLVSERSGSMKLINLSDNSTHTISGVPEVAVVGQGGLLDVEVDAEKVFFSYSASGEGGYATHVALATLNLTSFSLDNVEVLFVFEPFLSGGSHFGSRVLVVDEYVFVSSGDRGRKDFSSDHLSQNVSNAIGSVIRLHKNGSTVSSNPFVGSDEGVDEIFSYGHRNIQGLAYHQGSDTLWASEHGERDGDAIHQLVVGGNYGWPVAHTGCRYATPIPVGDLPSERDDVVDPVFVWPCGSGGFPPSGMVFVGDELFVGGLANQEIARFVLEDNLLRQKDSLLSSYGWRVRDVDWRGEFLYAVVDDGLLVRVVV